MEFLVLNLTVHILVTRLNVVTMRNAVPVPNTETTVTTAHRLGGNKLEEFLLITNLTHIFQCIYSFPFSTCFEQPSAHHQKNQIVSIHHMVYITLCR